MTRIPTDVSTLTQEGKNQVNPPKQMFKTPSFARGSLLVFNYQFWKHDPYPLVIVTDHTVGINIRGVNLHYVNMVKINQVLKSYGNNRGFSYRSIVGDKILTNAFRTYKWQGIRMVKEFDPEFLRSMTAISLTIDPNQVNFVRQSIREQMNLAKEQKPGYNPSAEELSGKTIYTPTTGNPVPTVPQAPIIGQI